MSCPEAFQPSADCFVQTGPLWRWSTVSGARLIFLRFTGDVADQIGATALMRRIETGRRRGWGSLKVRARIGATEFTTSIFPGDGATWLLPVKAAVRRAEGVEEADTVTAQIDV